MIQIYSTGVVKDKEGSEIRKELDAVCHIIHDSVHAEYYLKSWSSLDHTMMVKSLPKGKSLKILDLGSGLAVLQMYLAKKGHYVVPVDKKDLVAWVAEKKSSFGKDIYPYCCDFAKDSNNTAVKEFIDKYKGFFDVVLCNSVLAHDTDVEIRQAMKNVRQVLKPDGRFITTIVTIEKSYDFETGKPSDPYIRARDQKHLESLFNVDGFRFYSDKRNFDEISFHREDIRKFSKRINFRWGECFCMCKIVLIRKVER